MTTEENRKIVEAFILLTPGGKLRMSYIKLLNPVKPKEEKLNLIDEQPPNLVGSGGG